MRKFVTLFAAAALAVGGVSLTGCERETVDTTTPPGDVTTPDPDTTVVVPVDPADDTGGTGATTAPSGTNTNP